MIDLARILAANPPRSSWTPEVAHNVAAALVEGTAVTLDRDVDAGEEWISLVSGTQRVGIVSVSRPLAVLAQTDRTNVERAADLPLAAVLVPSFDAPVLVADADTLRAVFGTVIDVSPFSAEDLWFFTI
ncbi:hypothetical protein [Actinoplanes sp. DH11]|uniref:hypothetical protein n=1 Tax=Actinoplanes sp. DH11 TaxID=2857011 RepID=UPI001E4FBA09|nr:hypothetical protein [Actinoplanes sp. DH11]